MQYYIDIKALNKVKLYTKNYVIYTNNPEDIYGSFQTLQGFKTNT